MIPDVIVIGGGLAGLSASVKLVEAGANVLLIEKNNHLGGRTYSFIDKVTNTIVDNGQHLLVGAYKNTFKYLKLIGTSEFFLKHNLDGFILIENGKKCEELLIPQIPSPLNMFVAILNMKALSIKEKFDVIKLGLNIKNFEEDFNNNIKNITVEKLLDTYNQSSKTRKYLWYPLAISIMNESPDMASAWLFINAIKNTYFYSSHNSKIWIPSVGQSELYVKPAIDLIKEKKSKIILNTKVKKIIIKDGKYIGVEAGEVFKSKYAICAVPHFNFLEILPAYYLTNDNYNRIKCFSSSPIVSVNLWLDRQIMENEFVGLLGTKVHWVFNKSKIFSLKQNKIFYITAVISNAKEIVNLDKNKIVSIVMNDLSKNLPKLSEANVLYASVIKERKATFSASPGAENYRPEQKSIIENLYLAGDWTKTSLPATIEGAIYSGFLCADLIIKNK